MREATTLASGALVFGLPKRAFSVYTPRSPHDSRALCMMLLVVGEGEAPAEPAGQEPRRLALPLHQRVPMPPVAQAHPGSPQYLAVRRCDSQGCQAPSVLHGQKHFGREPGADRLVEIFENLARKLRSNDTIAPAAFAACMASRITYGVVCDKAAKIPPLWNQRIPSENISFQLKSSGFSCAAASLLRL